MIARYTLVMSPHLHIKTVYRSVLTACYFQDPDAVIVKLDPAGLGLLSFQTFCQGVATMMEANLNLPTAAAGVGDENGERILIELHLSPPTKLTSHLTLVL